MAVEFDGDLVHAALLGDEAGVVDAITNVCRRLWRLECSVDFSVFSSIFSSFYIIVLIFYYEYHNLQDTPLKVRLTFDDGCSLVAISGDRHFQGSIACLRGVHCGVSYILLGVCMGSNSRTHLTKMLPQPLILIRYRDVVFVLGTLTQ